MTHLSLLKKLEEFFDKDLKEERLSFKCSTKKGKLLKQIRAAIILEQRNNDFSDNQRQRTTSHERVNLSLPQVPSENTSAKKVENEMPAEQEDGLYMDLNDTQTILNNSLTSGVSMDGGCVPGNESSVSEDEINNRTKKDNESLEQYFEGTNYDVFSVVYVENKTVLIENKWLKRIGVVKECQFQCFKKLGDLNPVLDLPLRAYTAHLSTKENTSSIVVTLKAKGIRKGDKYRFSIDHDKMSKWAHVLRENAASFTEAEGLPAPPVAQRPMSSLPQHSPVQRTGLKPSEPDSSGAFQEGKWVKRPDSDLIGQGKVLNSAEMGTMAEMPESNAEDDDIYVLPDFNESVIDSPRNIFPDAKTKKMQTQATSPPPAILEDDYEVYSDFVETTPSPSVNTPPAVEHPGKGGFAGPANNSASKQKELNEANRPRTYSSEQSSCESYSASHSHHFQSKSRFERNKPIKKKESDKRKDYNITLNDVRDCPDQITSQESIDTSIQTR